MGNDRKRTGLGALAQAGDDDFRVDPHVREKMVWKFSSNE